MSPWRVASSAQYAARLPMAAAEADRAMRKTLLDDKFLAPGKDWLVWG
jgi:hypothetical protein